MLSKKLTAFAIVQNKCVEDVYPLPVHDPQAVCLFVIHLRRVQSCDLVVQMFVRYMENAIKAVVSNTLLDRPSPIQDSIVLSSTDPHARECEMPSSPKASQA